MSTDGPSGRPDERPEGPPEDRPAREPDDYHTAGRDLAETRTRQQYYEALTTGHGYEEDAASFASLMAARPAAERPEWEIPLSRARSIAAARA